MFSCKPIYKVVNGVNNEIQTNDKSKYCVLLNKKYNIDTSKLVFIDKANQSNLMMHLQDEKVSFFYGIVFDLKNKVVDSYLDESNNCINRINKVIGKNTNYNNFIFKNTDLFNYKLYDKNNEKVSVTSKKLFVFIFSTKIGRNNINQINKFIKTFKSDNKYLNYDYLLISID